MLIAVIYSLGALHGLILALVLAQKDVNKLPNRLLAAIMVVFAIDLGMAAYQSFGLHKLYPDVIGLDYPVTLLYGPLLYLYVKAMRDGNRHIRALDYLHFAPFAILVIYMIPFYTGPAADKLALLNESSRIHQTYGFGLINDLKVLHGISYVVAVIVMLISYRSKIKESYSTLEKINLNWLQYFITGTAVLAALAGGLHFIPDAKHTVLMGVSGGIYDDITLLAITAFVYGIGYMGLAQPEVFTYPTVTEAAADQSAESSSRKYEKSGLTQKEAKQYAEQLITTMEEEKLYRDSDLKLADLADHLDISAHNLTEIINSYLGMNFYDFVNSYRVDEVKRRLGGAASPKSTLLAIGLEAGFNSKSTFNSVFKKQTGMTPSQYRGKQTP